MERLKTSYEQLQQSSSAERFDLQDKIYKLRNELQDSKDHMAAEQIVLGLWIIIIFLTPVVNSQGIKKLRYAIQKSTKIKLEWTLLLLLSVVLESTALIIRFNFQT